MQNMKMKVDWCCRFGKIGDDGVGAIRRGVLALTRPAMD
jgi:hypothetical protein